MEKYNTTVEEFKGEELKAEDEAMKANNAVLKQRIRQKKAKRAMEEGREEGK